jgi:hypothetical protein
MKDVTDANLFVSESEMTGLPWPKTWKGTYLFVIGSFILWLILLIALTEFCA